jgi:hypothetical protein
MTIGTGRSARFSRYRPALERLEDRALPSASWNNFAHDPQHTADSPVATQPLDSIHWQAPVDLNPTGSFVHYGSPVITAANTVIVPVKTGANGGFELAAHNGATGSTLWTIASDYTLPPFDWMPPFGPAVAQSDHLIMPGNGGTVYLINNPNSSGATIASQWAFYGIANYQANPSAYNSTVMIDTPITAGPDGTIYFGFEVTGANPSNIVGGGIARIDKNGNGSWVQANTAASDNTVTKVPLASAPALSKDGSTLYVSVNEGGNYYGYLLGLNSTTLATKYKVFLKDPRNNNANSAGLLDVSTASPMVAPDGTVFYGIFGNPYNGSRGFLTHWSADLTTEYTPGAFGWDDTVSIVPASMVPGYHGTSSYLVFTKYNNYVAGETGGSGGDGVNMVAILDPYATQPDIRNDGDPNLQVMNEVLTMPGPTPDTYWVQNGFPNAVREWCINDTAVDPFTKSILVNSEDGNVYRWDLTTDSLTQAVLLTGGVGEPYVPTLVAPDGTLIAINGGSLFAIGGLPNYTLTDVASVGPVAVNQSVTFTATLASTNGGPTPIGTVTFYDGSNSLGQITLVNGQAFVTTSLPSVANHFIKASYSGDSNYAPGSTILVESVRYGSTAALTTSVSPSVYGQAVILTATVTPVAPGTVTPTGKVVLLNGNTLLGTTWLNSSGQASLTVSNFAVGSHSLSFLYNGDIFYVPAVSPALTQVVNKDTVTVGLTSSLNPSVYLQPVTFTATVTANAPGSGVPTGNVNFKEGSTLLGSQSLNSSGQAAITVSNLSVGVHHIRAYYVGNKTFSANRSTTLDQTVNSSALAGALSASDSSARSRTTAALGTANPTAAVVTSTTGSGSPPAGHGTTVGAAGGSNPASVEHLTLVKSSTAILAVVPARLDRFFAFPEDELV